MRRVVEVNAQRGHAAARNVAVSLPSFHVLLDVMRAVDFVVLVPEHMLRGKREDFRVFEPPVTVPGFDVIACWHARVSHHPAHRWVRELLAGVARRMTGRVCSEATGREAATIPGVTRRCSRHASSRTDGSVNTVMPVRPGQ